MKKEQIHFHFFKHTTFKIFCVGKKDHIIYVLSVEL